MFLLQDKIFHSSQGVYVISKTVGDVKVSVEDQSTVYWRLRDCLWEMDHGMALYYTSPEFQLGGQRWLMRLFPNWSGDANSEIVDFRVDRVDKGPPRTFRMEARMVDTGAEERGVEEEREIRYNDFWMSQNFCTRSQLNRLPGNQLVIRCTINTVGEVAAAVLPVPAPARHPYGALVIYRHQELQEATQDFNDLPFGEGGYRIGEGTYGKVYRAVVRGDVVAVKKLKDPVDRQFFTELDTLTHYKHENLLPLLGCSVTPTCCLLYEYMPNGSLEDRLACVGWTRPLSWRTRLSIAYGSALGINHLHTFGNEPVVHRDIKSANILLDENFVPKVGDFGLVRVDSIGASSTVAVTEKFFGTKAYMPREAYMGDISVKWDTFSFGVVLIELLTGLPSFDASRKYRLLLAHIENCEQEVLDMLDPQAQWRTEAAEELYRISQMCLIDSKKRRPAISEILGDLRNLAVPQA